MGNILFSKKVRIGYVPQKVIFLRRSIYDNLVFVMKLLRQSAQLPPLIKSVFQRGPQIRFIMSYLVGEPLVKNIVLPLMRYIPANQLKQSITDDSAAPQLNYVTGTYKAKPDYV